MQDVNDLGSVPDHSMLALFKSLIGFLSSEADNRGWTETSNSLRAVEATLGTNKVPARKSA